MQRQHRLPRVASFRALSPCTEGSAPRRTASPLFSRLSDSQCWEMLLLHISLPGALPQLCAAVLCGRGRRIPGPAEAFALSRVQDPPALIRHAPHMGSLRGFPAQPSGPSGVVRLTTRSLQFCLLYTTMLSLLYPSHVSCPPFCGLGRPSSLLCDEKSLVITDNMRKSFLCFRRLE